MGVGSMAMYHLVPRADAEWHILATEQIFTGGLGVLVPACLVSSSKDTVCRTQVDQFVSICMPKSNRDCKYLGALCSAGILARVGCLGYAGGVHSRRQRSPTGLDSIIPQRVYLGDLDLFYWVKGDRARNRQGVGALQDRDISQYAVAMVISDPKLAHLDPLISNRQ